MIRSYVTKTNEEEDKIFAKVKEKVSACIQCGTCTGSCPNAFAMDFTPRHLWRMVLMDKRDEIFASKTFILCSACYYCTLRCPRGLLLTEAMEDLKEIAAKKNMGKYKESTEFYKNFMESVKRHGRVKETEFITRYFMSLSMKKPFLPLKYTPVGIKLMIKGKLAPENPFGAKSEKNLESVFNKAAQMEEKV